jgi:ribosomal protein S18 acetylase RimI-like enzyme
VIYFKRVISEIDAEILRNVRNQCREFMTRHSDYITQEQQKEWFKDAHKKYELYIAYTVEYGAIIYEVGFGVIHKCDDCFMLTGGLTPDSRGRGFGKKIFKFLMDQCHKSLPIKLELLKNNVAAFKTYKKLGFNVVNEDDRLIFMEHRYDSVI